MKNVGLSFTGALTLVFITLKLTGYLTWSWVWVLSPIWIPLTLGILLGIIGFLMLYISR